MCGKGLHGVLYFQVSDIDEMTLDGGRDGHGRRDEMGAAASSLTPFEVAVAGRGAALSRLKHVGIHRQAHTATGFPPLEARIT